MEDINTWATDTNFPITDTKNIVSKFRYIYEKLTQFQQNRLPSKKRTAFMNMFNTKSSLGDLGKAIQGAVWERHVGPFDRISCPDFPVLSNETVMDMNRNGHEP